MGVGVRNHRNREAFYLWKFGKTLKDGKDFIKYRI